MIDLYELCRSVRVSSENTSSFNALLPFACISVEKKQHEVQNGLEMSFNLKSMDRLTGLIHLEDLSSIGRLRYATAS